MRDPSDDKFLAIQDLMESGEMVGTNRPVGRVTFCREGIQTTEAERSGTGTLRYIIQQSVPEYELFTINTISIDRSIGQDAATCTITLVNDWTTTSQPEGIDWSGRKGYLSPGRGDKLPAYTSVYSHPNQPLVGVDINYDPAGSDKVTYPTDWGYGQNFYRDALIPNTVLRTYQGYGSDNFDDKGNEIYVHDSGYVAPADDTKLYLTGVWLIDKVDFGSNGTISVECRDLAKLLIEQYIYPPMIPIDRFPLWYMPAHVHTGHKEFVGKNQLKFHSSSVDAIRGKNAPVNGHRGTDAFDGGYGSFWMSAGKTSPSGIEWIQATCSGEINEVVIDTVDGNHLYWVSIYENGAWQGVSTVTGSTDNLGSSGGAGGYTTHTVVPGDTMWDLALTYYGNHELWTVIARANQNIRDPHWIYPGNTLKIPNLPNVYSAGGDVKYVGAGTVGSKGGFPVTMRLPRTYNAKYVRVTFSNLANSRPTPLGTYLVGVREIIGRTHNASTFRPSTINVPGYIQDWSEAIAEMCAWAGFTWPNATPNPPYPTLGYSKTGHHPLRVWGDLEWLGAGPVVATPGDYFISKSFMDGIRQIVDFIGGIFYVDESGGVEFRLPNIWSGGNFIDDPTSKHNLTARIKEHPIELHEDVNLISYSMEITDAALRSEILVVGGYPGVNAKGPVAGGALLQNHPTSAIDFTNILAGQYRLMVVPGDSTKFFYTEAECQRMAELTALFILFTYRRGNAKIIAHPGLQLDDQVRIIERTTYERNIHYVGGIKSDMDLQSGSYTMDLTTHWLGSDPDTDWFVNKAQLTPAVLQLPAILQRIGMQPGGDIFEQPPYGVS